jgi:hypothetical protein
LVLVLFLVLFLVLLLVLNGRRVPAPPGFQVFAVVVGFGDGVHVRWRSREP